MTSFSIRIYLLFLGVSPFKSYRFKNQFQASTLETIFFSPAFSFFTVSAQGCSFFQCRIQALLFLAHLPKSSSAVVIFYACFLAL
jgi:hypothetical protein